MIDTVSYIKFWVLLNEVTIAYPIVLFLNDKKYLSWLVSDICSSYDIIVFLWYLNLIFVQNQIKLAMRRHFHRNYSCQIILFHKQMLYVPYCERVGKTTTCMGKQLDQCHCTCKGGQVGQRIYVNGLASGSISLCRPMWVVISFLNTSEKEKSDVSLQCVYMC